MYIKPTTTYYRGTEQHCRRGPFLVLMQPIIDGSASRGSSYPIRAIVRQVALRQLGHWMMGYCRIKGHRIALCGAYGADGLTKSVPMEVYLAGVELPASLVNEWNHGGGWNSAGSEATNMRKWALATFANCYRRSSR